MLYHSWVVVVHAIDVGPYLDLVGRKGCTDERCCIVAAASLQVVNLAISIAADETLCDVDLLTLVLLHDVGKLFLDVLWVWLCILVCAHEVERIEQHSLDALFLQVVDHHVGAHDLALSHDALLLERGEKILGEGTQIIEFAMKEFTCGFLHLLGRVELFHMLHVFLLQVVDYLVGTLWILLIEIVRDFNE